VNGEKAIERIARPGQTRRGGADCRRGHVGERQFEPRRQLIQKRLEPLGDPPDLAEVVEFQFGVVRRDETRIVRPG
jgi:hypothetical protein